MLKSYDYYSIGPVEEEDDVSMWGSMSPRVPTPLTYYQLKGSVAYRVSSFPKKFKFVSLCSFICLQAVYQLSGPVCKATWSGCPSYSASHLHFMLCD